ncbi:TnsA-like heteromeric transposase endonuclease subunit [Streptomyces iconiensis]|uniref:TnsA-like heteromeric transposase endonuclease subunit n=1 Tax=Streptomyces iconiensis TaxID=1384038 RepID=A0ABT6ZRK2_9ACTN|nr:TnsA-like heteromeric transposase endonuclease subunit [Streptomyces iconiensis]MDJ1131680.1 TnsA-like heteromeric transposase endonuclease subunit [Streptomyces iconiensis]
MDVAVTVSVRRQNGQVVEDRFWGTEPIKSLASAMPWRTFRWYKGQKRYSGTYWSATVRDHVIYESRLELSRLLVADFDSSVRGIVAQPFLLKTLLEGKVRRHIPDYLLLTREVPVVVDVKPLHRLSKPEVAFTFGWTRRAVESRGWAYEVWSEPPAVKLENIRFLAGYRRDWLFSPEVLEDLRELSSMVSLWGRPPAVCRIVRSLKSAPPSIICSGRGLSLPISIGRLALLTF